MAHSWLHGLLLHSFTSERDTGPPGQRPEPPTPPGPWQGCGHSTSLKLTQRKGQRSHGGRGWGPAWGHPEGERLPLRPPWLMDLEPLIRTTVKPPISAPSSVFPPGYRQVTSSPQTEI